MPRNWVGAVVVLGLALTAGLEAPRARAGAPAPIANAGGERLVAARALSAPGEAGTRLARLAANAGDRSPALVPILARGLAPSVPFARIVDASSGLASMGESAVSTRPALEALLEPDLAFSATNDVSHALARLRAAASGVVRLAGNEAPGVALDLEVLRSKDVGLAEPVEPRLERNVEHDDEEALEGLQLLGAVAAWRYEVRSIGLRALGALGPAASAQAPQIRRYVGSADPRLRYLASQALRRIGA